jgi:UDP-GlcNAc:undecaprenyl-phosphate GlcNAc-1-phosphate transferase
MIEMLLVIFLLSFVSADCLTPILRQLAIRLKLYDLPDRKRKVHKKPIPTLGGLSIFTAFYLPLVVFFLLKEPAGVISSFFSIKAIAFFIGGAMIVILGLHDDLKKLSPTTKLFFQTLIGLFLYAAGYRIAILSNPLGAQPIHLGVISPLITTLWVIGIINAFNLIDGIDGLAAGIGAFVSLNVLILALGNGKMITVVYSLALLGSLLGFLRYNFPPAKIFMGDTGSMFIGYVIAIIAIQGSQKGSSVVALLSPVIALGLPLFDTMLAIARRVARGKPILIADSDHIHHRLLKLGLSKREAVLIAYFICLVLWIFSLIITLNKSYLNFLILISTFTLALVGVKKLGYLKVLRLSHDKSDLPQVIPPGKTEESLGKTR